MEIRHVIGIYIFFPNIFSRFFPGFFPEFFPGFFHQIFPGLLKNDWNINRIFSRIFLPASQDAGNRIGHVPIINVMFCYIF
jgi:hypothetical protein